MKYEVDRNAFFARGERLAQGTRFYVWFQGRELRSAWLLVAPKGHDVTDCTYMNDGEFDEFMEQMALRERSINVPGGGDPGDPGRF